MLVLCLGNRHVHLATIWTPYCILISSSLSSCPLVIPLLPILGIGFGVADRNRKLPIDASTKESWSWKDNPIETRTRMIVGVMP